jgi:tetratricopeptide (TPR) repeat protein
MKRGWAGVCLVLCLGAFGFAGGRLAAQDPKDTKPPAAGSEAPAAAVNEARAHFQRGVGYFEEGDYRSAMIEFRRAYARQPTYRLLYNLGQVSYELRDYAAAERYFRRYLTEGDTAIPPDRRIEVRNDLENLRVRVASLVIRTNRHDAQIMIDDSLVGYAPLPGPVRVSAGQRKIVALHPGDVPVSRTLDVVGGEEASVSLDFDPPPAPAPQVVVAPAAVVPTKTNWAPWIAGIATGALVVSAATVGIWAWTDSSNYQDQLSHHTTRSELDSLASRARGKALAADVLLGAAAVSGAVTVILLLTHPHEDVRPEQAAGLPLATKPSAF